MASNSPTARIVMPVYDLVDMLDVAGPHELFGWAGMQVDLVACDAGKLRFRDGFRFEVDLSFDAVEGNYDALWVPGGDPQSLNAILADPDGPYLSFLNRMARSARYIASVCEGAMLLAGAGLLDGYQATTHWAFIPCFGSRFKQVKVVDGYPRFCLDRDRLTGGGISSGLDEALMLIQLLLGTAAAQEVQLSTQYYPQPPVSSTIPPTDSCPLDEPENSPRRYRGA
ncbi:MAG: transcriptional regulator [Alphaproteobacteria bacterium]|nr:transcriptional regulator [Alphaproteobacteria bacterium]